jgi:hypothetical protein
MVRRGVQDSPLQSSWAKPRITKSLHIIAENAMPLQRRAE